MKIPDGDLQQIVTNVMNDWNVQNDNYPSINRMQLDYSSESFSDGADEGYMGGDMRVAKEIFLDDSGSYLNSMDNMNDALHDFDLSEDEIDILISL